MPEFETMPTGQTALGRIGAPDAVGRVSASLLSPDNRRANAQNIEVGYGF